MSQLNVTSIAGIDGGTATTAMSGLAKVWSGLDGTGTIAREQDFNVSSITDAGTGTYDVTISNDMAATDYCGCANGNNFHSSFADASRAAGSYRVQKYDASHAAADATYCTSIAFGDLA